MNVRLMLKLLGALRELRGHEKWDRAQLEAYQGRRLHELRQHAYQRSPFYRKYHKGLTDRPLNELPVLTKAQMMEDFDELVTDRSIRLQDVRGFATQGEAGQKFRGQYWVCATSGSSGHPGFFLFDEAEWLAVLASFARSQEWSGVQIDLTHRQRMATVASISPWHMSSQVSATVASWWRPSLRVPASQPLAETVRQLNEWQPEVLIAYASMAGNLAEEQLAQRLHIDPKMVYVASEVLTPQTRRNVKAAWGDEPFNQYAATETAGLAAERKGCRHMHFLEDLLIVENVDEKNRPVPAGEYGAKLLVTTLFSRTQPLIRYQIDDSVQAAKEYSECGLPFAVLESIQGRVEDGLMMPAVAGGRVLVRPLVLNRVMDILPVTGWQVLQQPDEGLLILLDGARNGLNEQGLQEQVVNSLAQEGARAPYVEIQHVTEIPKTTAGKAPLIKAYHPASAR